MIIKYKLGDLAKDTGLQNKEVSALLEKFSPADRKHTTVLSEAELDFFFNALTQERQVKSLAPYFGNSTLPEEKKEEKKEPKKVEKPSQAGQQSPKQNQGQKPAQKPAQQPAARQEKQPQAGQQSPKQNQGQKPAQKPAEKRDVEKNAQKQLHKAENKAARQGENRSAATSERVTRVVDTRSSDVDLSKYNEKFDNMARQSGGGDNRRGKKSNVQGNKQKFNNKNKKNQQYQKKETEAQKLQRLQLEKARHAQLRITIPDEISVGELATRLKVTAVTVIKKLMSYGVMASVSEIIDYDTAALVADELGAKVEKEVQISMEQRLNIVDDESNADTEEDLLPRAPVVVVMGHVDHGKTSILDYIRKSHVQAGEAGGITQHIGAYQVTQGGKTITFLDTPGHEAFTAIRARGAAVTDVAVLVIAADDGIMPQTVEAINHAKAAEVPIIVALNKCDKPTADPDRVMQSLTEYGLVPEEWGGDVVCCRVSAKTGMGIDNLLEMINLVADMQELKANPNRPAQGTVIESRLDKGRGPIATILVQRGTLHNGDVVIAGTSIGRVRQMMDENGKLVESAGPSVPVEITGLVEVPSAGDKFNAVADERLARELVEQRRTEQQEEKFRAYHKVTLDNLFSQMQEGEVKELPIIVKADVQGSCEAIRQSLEKLSNEEVRVRIIHTGVGGVNVSDIMLADASGAIIIGFNVRPDPTAAAQAEEKGVEMRMYRIIYDAIDDVQSAIKGMLAPKIREVDLGSAEVRQVYRISSVGTIAGCYVTKGTITRSSIIRVVRDGIIIYDDEIASLKRFKDDVREVNAGYECGISLGKFNDIKEGDVLEAYKKEEYRD